MEASDRSFTTLPPALEQSPEAESPNPTTGPPLGNLTPPKGAMSGCRPSVTGCGSSCDTKEAVCRSAGEMLREAMERPAGSLLTDVDRSLDTSQIWGRVMTWSRCLHELEEAL